MSGENERKIEKFLDDENLIELRKSIKESEEKFNPFKILKIDNFEIRHSRMLAWLLDPKGHHGFGNKVLKGILKVLDEESKFKCALVVDGGEEECSDLEVVCEKDKIDILAYCKTHNLVVAIENKIYAGEDVGNDDKKGQLDDYVGKVNEEFPEDKWTQVFIYLTIDGIPPKGGEDKYIPFKHEDIYHIVSRIVEDNRESLESDEQKKKVLDFVDFYLELLEEKVMSNEKLDELCTELYRKHHKAINEIIERGKINNDTFFRKIWSKVQERYPDMKRAKTKSGFEFVHKEWKCVGEENEKYEKYSATFWFEAGGLIEPYEISLILYAWPGYENYKEFRKELRKELKKSCVRKVNDAGTTIATIRLKDEIDNKIDYAAIAKKIIGELEKEELFEKVINAVAKASKTLTK